MNFEVAPYGDVDQLLTDTTTRFCLIRADSTVIEDLSKEEANLFAAAPEMYVALKELYRLGLQGWRENRKPPTLISEGMQVVVLARELIRDLNVVDPATLTDEDWRELHKLLNGIDALQLTIGEMS